jgi:hypothetical protein
MVGLSIELLIQTFVARERDEYIDASRGVGAEQADGISKNFSRRY